jgi:uncharacterized membrane protein YdcZ (DUF606 family)
MNEIPWWMWMAGGFGCGVGFVAGLIVVMSRYAASRPYMPGPFSREGLK